MAINELLSILGSIIFVVVATVLLRVINLSRINRSKQFLSTIFSPVYAVISFLLIHAFQNKLLATTGRLYTTTMVRLCTTSQRQCLVIISSWA